MNKLRLATAALFVAVLGGTISLLLPSSEPAYQGRPLRAWLRDAAPDPGSQGEPQSAIRQIGTNRIPELLGLAQARDSSLKRSFLAAASKLTRRRLKFHTAADDHELATVGFYILGATGRDAVAALTNLLKGPDPSVRFAAADCLGNIGADAAPAVPLLLRSLDDTNRIARFGATVNLGRICRDPELVVPRLITMLNVSNAILPTTIHTLGLFGVAAKPAVPVLRRFLDHKDQFVRDEATNALKQIDPHTVMVPGVE